jgi:hypothetical protein
MSRLVGTVYEPGSVNADSQTCLNLMVEAYPKTAEGKALVNTPGYFELTTTGAPATKQVRGLLNSGNPTYIWIVAGGELYSYNITTDTWNEISTIGGNTWAMAGTTGRVTMAYMGLGGASGAIAVADGTYLNIYEGAGPTATQIVAPLTIQATSVTYLDGRFICNHTPTPGRFYYSDILAPTTFNEFNFATAEGSPDALVAVFANRRELYLFGSVSTEVWYSTGDGNSPFARYQGGFIETGLVNAYCVASIDNNIMWLARDTRGGMYVAALGNNYQPLVVSTPQINDILQSISSTSLATAYCMTYRLGGHDCWVLTMPNQGFTIVYDVVTKEWHQWSSVGYGTHNAYAMCQVSSDSLQRGVYLSTSATDSKLYYLSFQSYTDNGSAITRERTSGHTSDEQDRIRIASFQLDMEEGVSTTIVRNSTLALSYAAGVSTLTTAASTAIDGGSTVAVTLDDGRIHLAKAVLGSLTTTLQINPPLPAPASAGNNCDVYESDLCSLEFSRDGGQTYGTNRDAHMGVATTKAQRVIARQIGLARSWTVRFRTEAAVKILIRGAIAKLWGE